MRILLDTCTLLWLETESSKIPARLLHLLSLPETGRFVSAAAAWEIAIKWSMGRLRLPCEPQEFLAQARSASMIETVPIFESAVLRVAKLPFLHNDPFDRIMIAQALEHGLILATPDAKITQYQIETIWS